jgi:hypothetical protein
LGAVRIERIDLLDRMDEIAQFCRVNGCIERHLLKNTVIFPSLGSRFKSSARSSSRKEFASAVSLGQILFGSFMNLVQGDRNFEFVGQDE